MQPQVESFLTTFSSLLCKLPFGHRMSFRYERVRNSLEPKVSRNEELLSSLKKLKRMAEAILLKRVDVLSTR